METIDFLLELSLKLFALTLLASLTLGLILAVCGGIYSLFAKEDKNDL